MILDVKNPMSPCKSTFGYTILKRFPLGCGLMWTEHNDVTLHCMLFFRALVLGEGLSEAARAKLYNYPAWELSAEQVPAQMWSLCRKMAQHEGTVPKTNI